MADLSRRGFLAGMSVTTGVGIAGGLGLHQLLSPAPGSDLVASVPSVALPVERPTTQHPPAALQSGVTLAGPMVIHVRDVQSGELSLMVGTQELIYRDPDLVARVLETAAAARPAGA
jgi:hypothetical protein